MLLEAGRTLRGYTLVRRLGRGGDGDVWLVEDARGNPLALKAAPRSDNPESESRLRREFERLRLLRLPAVVRVLDVGAEHGWVFFTMELAHGVPFDRHVASGATLGDRVMRLARAGKHLARATAAIHRLGLAHRDIKPANVLVDHDGWVTVLDFGAMRFGGSLDATGEFTGTVHYMAPEQRVSLPSDHRVDLYALGVTLHESLSGVPASAARPGRPRGPLALLGREVPLALSDLVDRLVALDPAERPTAEEAERVLAAIDEGAEPGPATWPTPPRFSGDAAALLSGTAVIVGPPGTGRRRLVQEARLLWYGKGYRSIAGRCEPDRPYGAFRQIIGELFATQDATTRRQLAGDDAALLTTIWPELPVPVAEPEPWPPDPDAVGRALARVLGRAAPVAVVLWDLDQADPGTSVALAAMGRALPSGVLLWATSRRPAPGLPGFGPPAWSAARDHEVVVSLAAETASSGPVGRTPLQSAARAWRALARARGERGPAGDLPVGLVRLSVLRDPFPMSVARILADEVGALVAAGHLREVHVEADPRTIALGTLPAREHGPWLVFTDLGTRALAEAAQEYPSALHRQAAHAWEALPPTEEQILRVSWHQMRSGEPTPEVLRRAILLAIGRNEPGEVERWLRLKDLWARAWSASSDRFTDDFADDFRLACGRLRAAMELRPSSVTRRDLLALARRANTAEQRASADELLCLHDLRHGDRRPAIERAHHIADELAVAFPAIAAGILREIALARLGMDDNEGALLACRQALILAREARARHVADAPTDPHGALATVGAARPTRIEVEVATTLSAALLYGGRAGDGVTLCRDMAARCAAAGLSRGQAAFLINQTAGRLFLGERDEAAQCLAHARQLQARHRDPALLAWGNVLGARLAVERGDLSASQILIDEAMTAAQALGNGRALADAWTVALEAALHAGDLEEGARIEAAYAELGVRSPRDVWPAALGRWRWLTGDLPGALQATTEARTGYAGAAVEAERCRLLLVAGGLEVARRTAESLVTRAEGLGFPEIAWFARLVAGAAGRASDGSYLPLVEAARDSRWVHLYLGALHLDALRRKLRKDDPSSALQSLRGRARAVGHQLYLRLAREQDW